MNPRRVICCVALLALAGCARQGDRGQAEAETEAEATAAKALVAIGEIEPVRVVSGGSATLVVPVVVTEGYHVQANPAADEFLIPLELVVASDADALIAFGTPSYPPASRHRLAGSEDDLLVYEGTARIEVPLSAAPSAAAGPRTVAATLNYQACDGKRCYVPASLPLEIPVAVSAGEHLK